MSNCRTAFGSDERTELLRSEVVRRLRLLCAARGLAGIVLGTPAGVAWATGGANRPIDRGAGVDVIWAVIGPDTTAIVTTDVEAPRLRAMHDGELRAVAWWDSDAFAAAAFEILGIPDLAVSDSRTGSDVPGVGIDLARDLVELRLGLIDSDVDRLRAAGRLAADAVESALDAWRPGETDFEIAARIESRVVAAGGDCPVVIVGGDARVRSFRHPLSIGAQVHELAMAVLVARIDGLHVALTRYAATSVDDSLRAGLERTAQIRAQVLDACRPGAEFSAPLTELASAYSSAGYPDEWRNHYQGGPIGFAQREFEIAPVQRESRWWGVVQPDVCAFAWNPSLPGGAKDEDTYVVTPDGVELVTAGTWPRTAGGQAEVQLIAR